jgi:hypothetical protein
VNVGPAVGGGGAAPPHGTLGKEVGWSMLRFVLRRLVWAIPMVVFVTFLVYVALRMGTDPLASYLRVNQRASQKKIDQYIEANGLYEGVGGYLKGYFQWLGGFLTGDWPRSIKGSREVWPEFVGHRDLDRPAARHLCRVEAGQPS